MDDLKACLVIGHRGFRGIAPENTLAAARAALAAGADMWELDVAASSDGTLVVLHDDGLGRTTDAAKRYPDRAPWTVYSFTAAEIASFDAGSWYGDSDPFGQVAAGRVSRADLDGFAGSRIPTLAEALDLTGRAGWRVNVEIKDASGYPCDAWIAERVAEAIVATGLAGSALVSSFNHDYLRRVKAAAPGIATGALVETPSDDPVRLLGDLRADAYHPGLEGLERATVEAARNAGYGVNVWTVNEKADMRRLLEWGVSGIFTDFPDRLVEVLAE